MPILVVVAALAGVLVAGPVLNRWILWWVGRHVVVPVVLGRDLARHEVTGPIAARCAVCDAVLEWRAPGGLVWLAWGAAGGRCGRCGAPRPRWLAAVEVATGLGFAGVAARFGWSPALPALLVLVAGLVALSGVDLVYLRLPTPFVRVTAAGVAVAITAAALVTGPIDALAGAALGCALYGGFLLVCWLVSPRSLGYGDVRLGALIGAVVGWVAWAPDRPVEGPISGVLSAALAAGLVGTAVGTVLLVVRRGSHPFPFGPAMALGALVVVLALGPAG